MTKEIQDFLSFRPGEVRGRKKDLKEKIRTIPGTGFLEKMAKRFEVQPWPFVSYMLHHNRELLSEALDQYEAYDAAENRETIMEGLRENYIIGKVYCDIREETERLKKVDLHLFKSSRKLEISELKKINKKLKCEIGYIGKIKEENRWDYKIEKIKSIGLFQEDIKYLKRKGLKLLS